MNWLTWSTVITVDQIEEHIAVVEWDNEALSIVSLEWMPPEVQESQQLVLHLTPTKHSNCNLEHDAYTRSAWLNCAPHEPLYLPIAPPWNGNQPLTWKMENTNTRVNKKNHTDSRLWIDLVLNTVYTD